MQFTNITVHPDGALTIHAPVTIHDRPFQHYRFGYHLHRRNQPAMVEDPLPVEAGLLVLYPQCHGVPDVVALNGIQDPGGQQGMVHQTRFERFLRCDNDDHPHTFTPQPPPLPPPAHPPPQEEEPLAHIVVAPPSKMTHIVVEPDGSLAIVLPFTATNPYLQHYLTSYCIQLRVADSTLFVHYPRCHGIPDVVVLDSYQGLHNFVMGFQHFTPCDDPNHPSTFILEGGGGGGGGGGPQGGAQPPEEDNGGPHPDDHGHPPNGHLPNGHPPNGSQAADKHVQAVPGSLHGK